LEWSSSDVRHCRLQQLGGSTRHDIQVDRQFDVEERRPGERLFAFWRKIDDSRRAMAGLRRRPHEKCHVAAKSRCEKDQEFGDCSLSLEGKSQTKRDRVRGMFRFPCKEGQIVGPDVARRL